ncbi:MAG: hypothetical protein J5726_03960 [Treponema sp.]|nr:hypothetical protein [Treponema sp.]
MKKVLKLTALLLIAGAMMMGCKGSPDEEDDGLSGTWTKGITYIEPAQNSAVWSKNGSKYTFSVAEVSGLGITSGRLSYWTKVISDTPVTGVKLKMTCSSDKAGHGIFLQQDDNNKYKIMLRDGAVLFEEIKNGVETDLIDQSENGNISYWTSAAWDGYIYTEPTANEVVVYTTTSGSIKLLVNGKEIKEVTNPAFTSFVVAIVGQVTYNDQEAGKPVTSTYEFKKFQTKK